jgi:hypothetical protein
VKSHQSILTMVAVCALVACGGGGGSSPAATPVAVTPVVTPPVVTTPQVAITASNAKAVGSVALEAAGNPLVVLGLAGAIDVIARNFTPSVFTQPQTCPNGGSAVMGSNITDPRLLNSGDRFSASFSNCGITKAAGVVIALTGPVTTTVTFFTAVRDQFQSTMEAMGANFLNRNYEFSGTQIVVFEKSNQLLLGYTISGPSTKVKISNGALVRNNVWKDFMQIAAYGSGTTSYTLSATIQTDNPNVAAATSGFVVNTIAPIVRSDVTGLISSGTVSVVGAGNSRLTVTMNPGGSATIQIDANGDGVFETTVSATATELAAVL